MRCEGVLFRQVSKLAVLFHWGKDELGFLLMGQRQLISHLDETEVSRPYMKYKNKFIWAKYKHKNKIMNLLLKIILNIGSQFKVEEDFLSKIGIPEAIKEKQS